MKYNFFRMKSFFPKIKRIGFFFVFMQSCMTVCCLAQDAESVIVKMLPAIPSEITEPSKRAEYLTLHFWQNYNFQDTTFLMTNHLLEQSFVDFTDLLSLVPDEVGDKAIQTLLKKAEEEPAIFSFIIQLSERYLYEPDSPFCNEEALFPFMQYAIQSSCLNEFEKIRPAFLLHVISKNRIGAVANNLTYKTMNGETGNLHEIKANYILLYFNDPECEDCKMLIDRLKVSSVVRQFVASGKLQIITVYVNDDTDTWKKHAPDVPNTWIYSYDAEQKINKEEIYNIKQFPTLYLLDQDKKVLLKDASFDNLEKYIKLQTK